MAWHWSGPHLILMCFIAPRERAYWAYNYGGHHGLALVWTYSTLFQMIESSGMERVSAIRLLVGYT